jgi:hypothetical protein
MSMIQDLEKKIDKRKVDLEVLSEITPEDFIQ